MRQQVSNKMALERVCEALRAAFADTGYLDVSWQGERRKLSQNALYWVWCRDVAKARDDDTTERDVDSEMKMEYGFEIRRRNDHEFDELLASTIDKVLHAGRYEMAHALAKEIHCTSRLDKASMTELLEKMQAHWMQRAGIHLEAK